jgi:hypothetical protein
MMKSIVGCVLLIILGIVVEITWADEFQLVPTVALREEYNDNIFFNSSNTESDFITTIGGSLELIERTERLDMNLFGGVAPFFYADFNELDDTDQNYNGKISYQFTPRYSASIDGGYFVDNRPDRDTIATGLVTGIDQRRRWRFGADTAYQLSDISGIGLRYDYHRDNWKEENPEREDLTANDVFLGYNRQFANRLGLTTGRLNLSYGYYDFETSKNNTFYGGLGADHAFSERLTWKAELGARYVDSEFDVLQLVQVAPGVFQLRVVEESKKGWGMAGLAAMRYRLTEKTFSSLRFLHDIQPASVQGSTVVRTELVFFGNHKFTDKLAGFFSAGAYRNKADQDEFSFREVDINTFFIRPRIRWEFYENFTLEAAYSYIYHDDRAGDFDWDQNRVWVQIAYGLPLFEGVERFGPVSKWPGYPIR